MPDHVQMPDRKPVLHLYGDGSKNEFSFDFPIFNTDDLWVWLDEKRQTDGYEVRGINQSTGGSIVFTIPPSSGSRITLHRQLRFERTSDFPADAIIRAKAINDEFDYQTACLQQVLEELERCPQVSITSNHSTRLIWPLPQAGAGIGWSTDGKSLVNDPAQFAETVTAVKGYASAAKSAQDVTLASEQRTIAARDTAVRSETAAKESEQMAEKWAQNPEDEEVISGEYSALHWAKKSEHFARNYPVATTETVGVVELATVEEAKEGIDTQKAVTPEGVAAAFSRIASIEDAGIVKGGGNVDIATDGTLSVIQLGFTTMETITTSQTWIAPKTGYYRVTCIGAGGSGGFGGVLNSTAGNGKDGARGGNTSFGPHLLANGGEAGKGGGSNSYPTGGTGGGAGEIIVKYVFLEAGESVQIVVGAGGPRAVGTSPYTENSRIPIPPAGATAGHVDTSQMNTNWCHGGNGAVTNMRFGGGGGGGGPNVGVLQSGGRAKDGAENGGNGSGTTPVTVGYGGKGGDGAIIIEY